MVDWSQFVPATPHASGPETHQQLVQRIAQELGVDPSIAARMVGAESNWNPAATSNKGARGLMQVMPATGLDLGYSEEDLQDPEKNVRAGLTYYKQQMDKYKNPRLALAAYNAGPGNVDKYGGVPPFEETADYVAKILEDETADGKQPDWKAIANKLRPMAPQKGVHPPSKRVVSPGDYPLVGSPEHAESMVRGGASPAMIDEVAESEMGPGYQQWSKGTENLGTQYPVKVLEVVDADTIWVEPIHGGKAIKVRFSDIQAPESMGPNATQEGIDASKNMNELVHSGETLIYSPTGHLGKYGRPTGKLFTRKGDVQIDLSRPYEVKPPGPDSAPVGYAKGLGAGVMKLAGDTVAFGGGLIGGAAALVPGGKSPGQAFMEPIEWMEGTRWNQVAEDTAIEFISEAEGDKWIEIPGVGPVSFGELLRGATYMGGQFLDIFWSAGGRKGAQKLFGMAAKYDRARQAGMAVHGTGEMLKRAAKQVTKLADDADTADGIARKYMDFIGEGEGNTAFQNIQKTVWGIVDNFSEKEAALTQIDTKLNRMVQRHRSATRIAQGPIANETFWYDEVAGQRHRLGESFRDIWAGVSGKEMNDSDVYMMFERLTKDLASTPKLAKKYGVTKEVLDDANFVMKHIESTYGAKWNIIRQRMDRHYKWRLNSQIVPLQKLGAISEKAAKEIAEKHPHYSPFFRLATDPIMEAIEKTAKETGATGILDELVQLETEIGAKIKGLKHALVLPEGKPLKRLTYGLSESKRIGSGLQSDLVRSQSIHRWIEAQRVKNTLGRIVMADQKTFAHEMAVVGRNHMARLRSAKNTFSTFVDGEEVMYMTKNERLMEAINSLSSSHMGLFQKVIDNPVGKVFSGFTNLFRRGVVLGLEFMIRNPLRDQFSAGLFTKYGYNPFATFFSGLFHTISRDDVWRQFHDSGGAMSVFESLDPETITFNLQHMQRVGPTYSETLRKMGGGASAKVGAIPKIGNSTLNFFAEGLGKTSAWSPMAAPKTMIHGLQRVSEIFEEATRVGAFNKARKRALKGKGYTPMVALDHALGGVKGMAEGVMTLGRNWRGGKFAKRYRAARGATNPEDWIDEAREITLDFSRRGHFGELMNGLIPFANAELQDVSRFYRALRDQPLTTMTRGFAFMTIPALVNWYQNFDNPEYRNLPATERALFFHWLPFSERFGKFWRFPRPVGSPQVFMGYGVEKMMDWLTINQPEAVQKLSEELWPGRSPMGDNDAFLEWRQVMASTGPLKYLENYGANLIPQAIAPVTHTWANKDPFFGGNIVGRGYEGKNEPLPEQIQNESTSQIMSPVASMVRGVGSFTKWKWMESMNPLQAEYLFRRYTGSVGGMALEAAGNAMKAAEITDPRAEFPRDITTMIGAKGFASKSPWGPSSDSVEDFYRHHTESTQAYNSLKLQAERQETAGFKKTLSKHPEWSAHEFMEGIAGELSDIWRTRSSVAKNRSMDPLRRKEIVTALDQQASQISLIAVDIYRQMMGNPTLSPEEVDGQ